MALPAPKHTLWLARHAQPLVAPGVCYGQHPVPACPEHTSATARALADRLPTGLRVQCSPLPRCVQLAQTLEALRPDLPYQCDPRLQELHFGQWEGLPWASLPRAELHAWTEDFAHYRAGGNGESTHQFMARVGAAFDALADQPPTLWITHAGVARAATLLAQGVRQVTQASQWPTEAPAYGQGCTLALPRSGEALDHTVKLLYF